MLGETLEKPPSGCVKNLPQIKFPPNRNPKHSSLKVKEKSIDEKAVHKFTTRHDLFHGILRRVSEMKLNGSLDSEAPSTGSEKSESSIRRSDRLFQSESGDACSNASNFEDESSSISSITGSDHCPPYEEIPRISCDRDNFPPPPSPTDLNQVVPFYQTIPSTHSSGEYQIKSGRKRQLPEREAGRPKSLSFAQEESLNRKYVADVNDNCTNYCERRLSLKSNQPEGITDGEKQQLEMFFKSLKTDVFVCGSLVNLYFGWKENEGNWTYRHTGVVVVIFDSGDTRSRNKRKIQILLAERGTCFPLWRDTIDNLSSYHRSGAAFHTMCLSSDHRQMAGFSFDCSVEAEKLLKYLEDLTSNPENINISGPGSTKKKSTTRKKTVCLPHKEQISNPCLFQHVTSVAARDKPIYMSLQTLIDNEIIKEKENIS